MPKNKRPAPRKTDNSPEEKDDALTQSLCDLAIDLVEQEDSESMGEALKLKETEFKKIIKKCLNQKKDEILYESLERAKYVDSHAYRYLKDSIEEAAGTLDFRRDDGVAVEINAFIVPLFAWSTGGLDQAQCCQDQEAFDVLTKSFQQAQLESKGATVVLVNHVYCLDEIDGITYSHLNQMVRDAAASMTDKKIVATPAIERSIAGWPANIFSPDDTAVELRFLLGFALKAKEDAFYQVPDDEAAADDYFETRAVRFQHWAGQFAPTVKRCLVTDGSQIDLKFLYQDLFHGGKERGMAEYFLLQMMAELNRAIHDCHIAPEKLSAIIGPIEVADKVVLRVNLYAETGALPIASSDKTFGILDDLPAELDDVRDALTTMGIATVSVAMRFDANGRPVEVRPTT